MTVLCKIRNRYNQIKENENIRCLECTEKKEEKRENKQETESPEGFFEIIITFTLVFCMLVLQLCRLSLVGWLARCERNLLIV